MKINLEVFTQSLLRAETEPTFTPPQVSDYVLRHIYEPLARDEGVLFSDLDFSAFDNDGLAELETMLDACEAVEHRLAGLNQLFQRTAPVSTPVRTFC